MVVALALTPFDAPPSPWVVAALEGFALVGAGLGGGILVYALGSFALMRRHVAPRPVTLGLLALLREVALAGATQVLLPLFYFVGRRLGPKRGAPRRTPVVLVHGYMQNRVDFISLAWRLRSRGLGPIYGVNYPWFLSIESNARRLAAFVARVKRETGAAAVDLVCHSMGGLVALEYMRTHEIDVRRCATIASPHAGVVWRGPMLGFGATALRRGSGLLSALAGAPLSVPCLSVYSTHDNVVHPKESSQLGARGGRDVEVADVGHLTILFDERVARHVGDFLEEEDMLRAE
jgi:triacylglycerol lipase